MKQIRLLVLTFVFFGLVTSGVVASKTTRKVGNAGWKQINETSYSLQYPTNWDLNKPGPMGTSHMIFSKQLSAQDQFRENVNLVIQDLRGQNINLDSYVAISEGQIKTMITNSKLIESKRMHENGVEFHRVIYTGNQGLYKLKFEQYYLIKSGMAYVLTLTCEASQFDAYRLVGEKMLNSFRLK